MKSPDLEESDDYDAARRQESFFQSYTSQFPFLFLLISTLLSLFPFYLLFYTDKSWNTGEDATKNQLSQSTRARRRKGEIHRGARTGRMLLLHKLRPILAFVHLQISSQTGAAFRVFNRNVNA